jgi:hypothetical protein
MSLRRTLLCLLVISSASSLDCHRNREASEGSGVNNARPGSDTGYPGTATSDGGYTGETYDSGGTGTPGTTGSGSAGDTGSPGNMPNDAGTIDGRMDGGSSDAGAVSDGGYHSRTGRDAGDAGG